MILQKKTDIKGVFKMFKFVGKIYYFLYDFFITDLTNEHERLRRSEVLNKPKDRKYS